MTGRSLTSDAERLRAAVERLEREVHDYGSALSTAQLRWRDQRGRRFLSERAQPVQVTADRFVHLMDELRRDAVTQVRRLTSDR